MSSKKRNQVIPAVFLILKKENKILFQRRFNTGFQDGQYTFPSGHIEKGENPSTAVIREAKEEVGISVKLEDIAFEQVLYRRGFNNNGDGFDMSEPERVDFFFSCEKWEGDPVITEPDKCDDLRWFPIAELPKNVFPVVKTFLEAYPSQASFQEAGY